MLEYLFAGLALGSVYALASASLVITYVSTGVVNFAFGAMAFFVARFYYWLNSQHGWGILPSAVLALLVVAPALGALLYVLVLRHLRTRPQVIRIVTTIGISVALPPLALILFGDIPIPQAPGLAPNLVDTFRILGATVNMDQVMVYAFLVIALVAGTIVLRFTDTGLRVRALVDSASLTSLCGVAPARVAIGVWMVTTTLAGAVGILVTPIGGLGIGTMMMLMASAFAAVVAARLRSIPIAVLAALAIGVVTDVIQFYLPADGDAKTYLVPAIPFIFILVFLGRSMIRPDNAGDDTGGPLDRAIALPEVRRTVAAPAWSRPLAALPVLAVAVCLLTLDMYWANLLAMGCALAVVMLSITVATGEGGMIWLCQITFAGGGGIVAAELATHHGWPPLLAVLIGALAMVPVGLILGALTIRVGDLHVALVTLSFGLLVEVLVFPRPRFYQGGLGVDLPRPGFLDDDRVFGLACLAIFVVLALIILRLRRSTTGLAMGATRSSPQAARMLGVPVVGVKMLVVAVATFAAGLGGGLLGLWNGSSDTTGFSVFAGLVWLAVVVTFGVRSITGALAAAIAFAVMGAYLTDFLPPDPAWLQGPALLFGLGAIAVARRPEGVVVTLGHWLAGLAGRLGARRDDVPGAGAVVAADTTAAESDSLREGVLR